MSEKTGDTTGNKAGRTDSETQTSPTTPARQALRFRTDNLKSSYCNMANATSTREEVVLNFGINQNWDQPGAGAGEVDLQHRIIISPFAAKRLSDALLRLMRDYEQRYGPLG